MSSLSHRYRPSLTSIHVAQLIGAVERTRLGVIFHMIGADDVLAELYGIAVARYPVFLSAWRSIRHGELLAQGGLEHLAVVVLG